METANKLETMEEELKLLKGELKESLASVRDYLLNMELPASEFASMLEELGNDGSQKMVLQGNLTSDKPPEPAAQEEPVIEETREEFLEPEDELTPEEDDIIGPEDSLDNEPEAFPEDELDDRDDNLEPEAETDDEPEEPFLPESVLPREAEPAMARGRSHPEPGESIPKVNLLANLMHWVTKTKKEIGTEQLAAFLEVYGISGHLSPELKELILHMAEIAAVQPDDSNTAEIWSQAMLSLHGVLTGGDAPLHPVKPFWREEENEIKPDEEETSEAEMDKPEDQPFKLKLVLPTGQGKSQEFCLDLKPEVDNNDFQSVIDINKATKKRGDVRWQQQTRKRK